MEDNQNGVIDARPPVSDTCGMIVDYSGNLTAALPPAVAASPDFDVSMPSAAPLYGAHLNNNNNNNSIIKRQQAKGPGNSEHRSRRPRRGKRKSKKIMPYIPSYMKNTTFRYKALAPNNTNQFLMDDHNDAPDIEKLSARYNNENGRTRNSSYTSVESEGDHIYSSSDEDGTSIQKEFIDTYRLVQEEELAGLSKHELTERVIELEEKIQVLESKRCSKNIKSYLNGTSKDDEEILIDPEEYRLMQIQIRELTNQNKSLQAEVETLKQGQIRNINSDSSIDSESSSDSSESSSSSSDEQEIEMNFLLRGNERDDQVPKDN